jgi:hypothetical protein
MYLYNQRSFTTAPFGGQLADVDKLYPNNHLTGNNLAGHFAGHLAEAPAPRVAGPLSPAQLANAVTQNQTLGQRLGWDALYDAIASWILNFQNMTPAPPAFAQSVASWQLGARLPVNGVLDFNTWRAMLREAKAGIPRPFQTPERVARPHGLKAIVDTFGDPTKAGWEARNIMPVTAPGGRLFAPRVRTQRVHRLIAPHFNRLFTAIFNAGLWNELFPSSGTYLCRTKHSYGKKLCGEPGILFNQLSTHSWGITIDIRANDYPYFTDAMQSAGRRLRCPPPTITKIFQAHGFHWGLWFMNGNLNANGRIRFNGADPMHFQFATGY